MIAPWARFAAYSRLPSPLEIKPGLFNSWDELSLYEQPVTDAKGDDNDGNDDEDGVAFQGAIVTGASVGLNVTASQTGLLNVRLDFNRTNGWADTGEQIFTNKALSGGSNSFTISIPANASPGNTYARFRFSNISGLSYTGMAPNGEVEDYLVTIVTPTPTPTPTVKSYLLWTK